MLPLRTLRHLALPFLLASTVTLPAQIVTNSDLPEKPRLEIDPEVENGLQLTWFGREGFSYFLQTTTDLVSEPWQYLPVIETAQDAEIHYGLTAPSPRFFARVVLSEQTAANPMTADFDGDGISNIDELNRMIDPLANRDDDGDGHPDDWERYYFNDTTTTNDAFADQDTDGLSDYEEAMRGTDPELDDTDGDGVLDDADGWPRHAWITAAPLPAVRYAVIPLVELDWPDDAEVLPNGLDDRNVVHGTVRVWDQFNGIPYHKLLEYVALDLSTGALQQITGDTLLDTLPDPTWVTTTETLGISVGSGGYVSFQVFTADGNFFGRAGKISADGIPSAIDVPPVSDGASEEIYSFSSFVSSRGELGVVECIIGGVVNQEVRVVINDASGNRTVLSKFTQEEDTAGVFNQSVDGGHFIPYDMNSLGMMVGGFQYSGDIWNYTFSLSDFGTSGVVDITGTVLLKDTASHWSRILDGDLQGIPVAAFGKQWPSLEWLAAYETSSGVWTHEPLQIWDSSELKTVIPHGYGDLFVNNRMEMLDSDADTIIRNGSRQDLAGLVPPGWDLAHAHGLNNHGVILASAKRTIDAAGLPIPPANQVSEPVLLVPYYLAQADGEEAGRALVSGAPVYEPNDGIGKGVPIYHDPSIISA